MPGPFDFIKRISFKNEKKKYKNSFIKQCEPFEFYINSPLSSVNGFRNAAQSCFPQLIPFLEKNPEYGFFISKFENQLLNNIACLTDELATLRKMAEKQPVNSEESLVSYKKMLNAGLLGIKKRAEALIQETDQDITKLVNILARFL